MNFRYGELFSGPGGLSLAAVNSKVRHNGETYSISHQWSTDYDKDSCKTYKANIRNANSDSVVCKDVRKINIQDMPPIDALAFGFPCNDFSAVGEKRGMNGEYGALYQYGVKALKHFQPLWFLAENVSGIRNANQGEAFKKILLEFGDSGYNIVTHLFRFEGYGVPQNRHRIIIVGFRKDLEKEFRVPMPDFKTIRTAREAMENPPITPDVKNNEYTNQSTQVIERLKHIKPGENAFNANIPNHLKLNVKGATISLIYRRLHPDKPAYTVTGSGGGGTHMYHWEENRALTNRERARLQTFPDDFVFSGTKESVRKQIGMAVPVEGAKAIFRAILKTAAGVDYPSVEPSIGNGTSKLR